MAKRKPDFKPDKTGKSLLNRLTLSRRQRLAALRWLLYSLTLLVLSVVQDVLLARLRLFGAATELIPCAIFLICILEGSENGCVFCLVGACLYAFSGTAPGVFVIPLITLLGIFAAIGRQSYLQKGFSASLLCTAAAMLLYELSVFAIGLFLGYTVLGRIQGFCLTAGLTVLSVPVLYPITQAIGKIGGETWKE